MKPEVGQAFAAPSLPALPISSVFLKTKMCRFHVLGACVKGTDCPFAHMTEELQPAPNLFHTRMCKMLRATGHCDDPACRYAHNKEEIRRTIKRPSAMQSHLSSVLAEKRQETQGSPHATKGQLPQRPESRKQALKALQDRAALPAAPKKPQGSLPAACGPTSTIEYRQPLCPGRVQRSGDGYTDVEAYIKELVLGFHPDAAGNSLPEKEDVPAAVPFHEAALECQMNYIKEQQQFHGSVSPSQPQSAQSLAFELVKKHARSVQRIGMAPKKRELQRQMAPQDAEEDEELMDGSMQWEAQKPVRAETEPIPDVRTYESVLNAYCGFVKNTFLDFEPRSAHRGDSTSLHFQAGLLFNVSSYCDGAFGEIASF